jgi:hypothetical protein
MSSATALDTEDARRQAIAAEFERRDGVDPTPPEWPTARSLNETSLFGTIEMLVHHFTSRATPVEEEDLVRRATTDLLDDVVQSMATGHSPHLTVTQLALFHMCTGPFCPGQLTDDEHHARTKHPLTDWVFRIRAEAGDRPLQGTNRFLTRA